MSHYIPAFTEINGRDQKAACGSWVRAHEHSDEPTCEGCLAYVQSEAATGHLTDDDIIGVNADDPLMRPVKPSFAAHSDAQRNSGRERHR